MCGSGCSGRGRTKCYRLKRSGVNVITHKGQDAFCVRACDGGGKGVWKDESGGSSRC